MSVTGLEEGLPENWAHVPTLFVDGAIGSSHAGGVRRILLGSVTFNTDPGATDPTYRPVCELAITFESLRALVTYLKELPEVADIPAPPEAPATPEAPGA